MTRAAVRAGARRLYIDQTHVRGAVTGIERVALDLFTPKRLEPHEVRAVRSTGILGMIAAQQIGLPLRGYTDRSALFVFPGFPPAPLSLTLGDRCIVYVHDTFLLTRPEDLSWKSRLYMTPSFRLAMRFGRRFLVNSRTTADALRAHCAPGALVALLRPAVRDVFGLRHSAGPATYTVGQPLRLLAIGTIEPRKNYAASIALVAALNAAGIPAELHIVGRVGWGRHAYIAAPPPFLTLHGYVDDAGLRRLVERCHLLLSTSKAEGLGLPLLEVQHGGMPIVAPGEPVFTEVLGESACFVAPQDAGAAAEGLVAWIRAGGLARAPSASRDNVDRWNALAQIDAARFQDFLAIGVEAYENSL